jgi:transcriptional regulator GlxA family with amidase domain
MVRRVRLDRAATLLAHSNYTIAQVAEMCGFANPFHFSRRFKEAFGQSPSEVRVNIRRGAIP